MSQSVESYCSAIILTGAVIFESEFFVFPIKNRLRSINLVVRLRGFIKKPNALVVNLVELTRAQKLHNPMGIFFPERPAFRAFESDGYVFTQCHKLGSGWYVCREGGLYYRFKKYARKEMKTALAQAKTVFPES
jgi:hypothetical protein